MTAFCDAGSMAALIGGTVRLVGGPLGGALYALTGFAPVAALDAGSYLASAVLITYTGTILHATAGTLGLLFGALGVGHLAGAPISRAATTRLTDRPTDRTIMTASTLTLGAVFAAAFNIHDTAWDLVLFALIGPPAVCFLATANTYLACHTPDHLLGRANSAYGTLQAAATLAGMLAGSVLGQRIGIGATVNLAALTVAASAAATLRIPSRIHEQLPGQNVASIPAIPEQARNPQREQGPKDRPPLPQPPP